MEKGKKLLEDLINGLRSTANHSNVSGIATYPMRKAASQQVSVLPQPEIFALDPEENADLLSLWHEQLLPQFPTMVRDAMIEGSYSVTLVRQKVSDCLCPVIRFRSSGNQSDASRKLIRDRVQEVCVRYATPILQVQFTEGTLVRLVGGSTSVSVLDDPPIDQRFPHQRRPWGTPGMGASIGLSRCPHVSATLGGYISADDRIYMLTVDHFISECQCEITSHVRSPSISDIYSVRFHLGKKLQELDRRVVQSAPDEVPLDQVEELLFPTDIDEEVEQYRRVERELDDNETGFALGMVRVRCGDGQLPLRPSADPRLIGVHHRMDWSLSEITARHRKGKNIHRYGRTAEPRLEDLQNEVIRAAGAGTPCTTIEGVMGGESVYYVGTTSGLREGFINPARVQFSDEFGISEEWAMVVPNCERLRDCDFQGDSGAWLISNDNTLLGLLWGWDNGNLLFTPIHDVFADIKQKMNSQQIRLPDDSTPRSGRQGSLLCRRSFPKLREPSPERFRRTFPTEFSSPPRLLPPISMDEKRWRRRSSGASSTWSMTSTPSLLSSASSSADELSPRVGTPQDPVLLPIRTKARTLPSIGSGEEWVCVHPNGDLIEEKFSALELAEDVSDANLQPTAA